MATGQFTEVIRRLRGAALVSDANRTDGELLQSFIRAGDEAALEALMRRHGPMVLGVCRRVLHHAQDAEDAFQATFLVLVRKAARIGRPELLGNWLYGVAYRAALEARAAKRRVRERQVKTMPEPECPDHGTLWRELRPLLDEELNRLPDKYRVAVVLCDLEGRTRKEVARQLGIPEGTLSGRLTSARRLLAKRLARRGLLLSVSALATLLSEGAASACVPAGLAFPTIQAAARVAAGQKAAGVVSAHVAALTEGVLKGMLLNKFKLVFAFLLLGGILALAGGMLAHQVLAQPAADQRVLTVEHPIALATGLDEQEQQKKREQRPKESVSIAAEIQATDVEKSTVTIEVFARKEGKVQKTLAVAKDAIIQAEGKAAKLGDLKKGSRAMLKLSADQKTVLSIHVAAPTITGPLKAVDAVKRTITVTVGTRVAKEDKTYQVAKDAKVMIEGKEARLSDLKEGGVVTLSVAEGTTVIQVRVQSRGVRKVDE